MTKVQLLENKKLRFSWVIIFAFFIGIAMIVNDISRLTIFMAALVLPLLFYISQQPLVFILKCMLTVVLFVPFQYYDFLNLFRFLNPLVILGVILSIKLFSWPVLKRRFGNFWFTIIDKLYFVFLFSALISSFYAISILGSLNWIFYSVTTGYFVYRAILTLDFVEVKSILKFLVFAASLSALYGIGSYAAGQSLIYGRLFPDRLTSLVGHPVVSGLIFAIVFPFSLAIFIETRKKIYILTSLIIFAAVILTFSRGSWLALVAGLLAMVIFSCSKIKLRLIVAVIVVASLIGAFPFVNQAIIKRLHESETSRYSSFNIRKQSFPIAFSVMKDKPLFGGGPFNAARHKGMYTADPMLKELSFENTYLGLLVDLGLAGMCILFFLGSLIIKRVVFSPWGCQETNVYRSAVISSLVILFINIGTFNFDTYRIFHFVAWFSIALTQVLPKSNPNLPSQR